MPPYPLVCYRAGCGQKAVYKVAARWSDGLTNELKTYGLVCEECLAELYRASLEKQKKCRRAPGEKLDPPSIFQLVRGQRDRQLHHRADLEEQIAKAPA